MLYFTYGERKDTGSGESKILCGAIQKVVVGVVAKNLQLNNRKNTLI